MRSRLSPHARLLEHTTGKKEGGSAARGTEESDRTSSFVPAEIKVCSRAVLPGGGCTKHQTIGPLPEPGTKAATRPDDLVSNPRRSRQGS